jgi:hypothetical protein
MSTVETWGDRVPRLKDLPGYEAIAATPTSIPIGQSIDPVVRDRVNACPERGSELSVVIQSGDCCGGGSTRFECQLGKGSKPGQVTLRECLQCQS